MAKEEKRSRMPQIGEAIFCVAYLLFDLIAAVFFFVNADGHTALYLFGILTLVLGGGDAFHLVPRIVKAFRGESPAIEWWAGLGLMVSSVTMTIFYVLLFYVWKALFPNISYPSLLSVLLWCSAVIRIVLCLFPQNNWFRPEGNPAWGIYRNLPFLITGLCVVVLFFLSGNSGNYGLWKMSIAIIISFSCYWPVVLFSKQKPAVGMLMMPKTIAYVWMIVMGLGLIGKL